MPASYVPKVLEAADLPVPLVAAARCHAEAIFKWAQD